MPSVRSPEDTEARPPQSARQAAPRDLPGQCSEHLRQILGLSQGEVPVAGPRRG
ncbi:MAG: hypothetical protein FJ033_14595 [Chloroflexi bacterium]|nr:hypothetical protein [Chloroflexota bacterium]